jgi:hypothetical protein
VNPAIARNAKTAKIAEIELKTLSDRCHLVFYQWQGFALPMSQLHDARCPDLLACLLQS